MLHEFPP